jgi:hypothetical protein
VGEGGFVAFLTRFDGNNNGALDRRAIIIPPPHQPEKLTGQGKVFVKDCQDFNQNFCHIDCHTPARGHRKTSPLREMAAHHRLSDFFEFLSTFYGIEGEESLEILGRFLHHA